MSTANYFYFTRLVASAAEGLQSLIGCRSGREPLNKFESTLPAPDKCAQLDTMVYGVLCLLGVRSSQERPDEGQTVIHWRTPYRC